MHGNSFGTSVNYAILKEQLVPGEEPHFIDFCGPDVEAHMAQVRLEFAGQPELFAYHASLIIKLRRNIDVEATYAAFVHLWRHERVFLLENLDSRWLVSALDTFADHGTVCERLGALSLLAFMNMLKLAQTEHMLCGSPPYKEEEIRRNIEDYPVMWDNRRVFHLPDDDTFINTVRRLRRELAREIHLAAIFEVLLKRALDHDTTLSRLARHHKKGLW